MGLMKRIYTEVAFNHTLTGDSQHLAAMRQVQREWLRKLKTKPVEKPDKQARLF